MTINQSTRDILITSALPYANGPLHLGHMVEIIQADVWARFQRSRGHHCLFICGDDAHGTPIMLAAQKQGIKPEELIEKTWISHNTDCQDFLISFDNFYTTHSPENQEFSNLIYQRLNSKGDIFSQTISQAYDPVENIFLPDRYIKGECPRCGAKDQYGDNCEVCGASYTPMELKNPISAISGAQPITKTSGHFFLSLDKYSDFLQDWIQAGHLHPQVAKKLQDWFGEGLRPWDITRDAPYFGFEIPNAPGKYFYVWLDAPVGYMASLKNLIQRRPDLKLDFDAYWKSDSKAELYHFVGKDIVYFHALFWPAILKATGFRLPNAVFVHGYLTINNQKMSKSRGTFITVRDYLKHLDPEYLRYYFAAKLGPHQEDIDLNLEDFALRVNADLVGKYINLASRCAGFITKLFEGKLANQLANADLFEEFVQTGELITTQFESLNYNKAIREIMLLADRANQYIDYEKPWSLAKNPLELDKVQRVCTQGINLFRILSIYLKPILPKTVTAVEEFLNIPPLQWEDNTKPLLGHTIAPFKPLIQRVLPETIELIKALGSKS